MKPGAPWSIKGVDADAREIAKAKARASDMTLGQWLNQAIADADKPPVAAPAPPVQAGSSLDTARLMRAISEVARRVDQVRDGSAAPVDLGRVEQALANMGRRMEALEQRGPAAPDLSGLGQTLDALNQKLDRVENRMDGLAQGQGSAGIDKEDMAAVTGHLQGLQSRIDRLAEASERDETDDDASANAAVHADLRRVMNGMLNLARKIDGIEAQVAAQLAPLKAEIAELRAATEGSDADPAHDRAAMEALRDDLQDLKQAMAARPAETTAPERDMGPDLALALAPVMASIGALQARIDEAVLAPSEPEPEPEPEPVAEAVPEPEAEVAQVPEETVEPEPEPGPAFTPEAAGGVADPVPEDDAVAGVVDDGSREDPADPDDAPMQRPEPGALQALHDLTARRDTVSRRVEPILRDLPDEPPEPEQPDASQGFIDDDRPDFDTVADMGRQVPDAGAFVAEPEPAPEPEPEHQPEPELAPAEQASPAMAAADEAGRDRVLVGEIDDPRAISPDATESGEVDDIPEVAAAPDRPRRIVPVESLLAAGGPDEATVDAATAAMPQEASPRPGVGQETPRARTMDAPLAAERTAPAEPRERRRGAGYFIAALIFLAVLVGGFFLIGSDRFNQWMDQGRQMVASLSDMVPLSGQPASDDPATGTEATADATASASSPGATLSETAPVADTAAPAVPAPTVTSDTLSSPAPDDADPGLGVAPAESDDALASTAPASEPAAAADEAAAPAAAATGPATPPATTPAADPATGGQPDFAALESRAEAGDAEAQYQLGVRYRDGDGVGVSYGESASWFQSAAEQGHVPAQVNLGIFYRQGVGVAKDVDLAKVWFHAAARAGHPEAQNFLGQVYVGEEQDRPDYFQAARWFREAAEQGVLDAQYNLASLYMGGLGVPRDDSQAYFWFGVAAGQGDRDAAANQANVAAELSPAERAEQDARIAGFRAIPQYDEKVANASSGAASGGNELRRRDQIRLIQRLLISRGYDPGQPDGLPGEQTREAIRQFEADNGLTVTGKITDSVLQALQQGG